MSARLTGTGAGYPFLYRFSDFYRQIVYKKIPEDPIEKTYGTIHIIDLFLWKDRGYNRTISRAYS